MRVPQRVIDWLPVVVLPPVFVIDAAGSADGKALGPVNVAVAILVCVPLAFRRRLGIAPMVVLIVAGVIATMALLHPGHWIVLLPMVAVYELARRFDRRRAWWIAAVCVPGVLAGVLPFSVGFTHTASIVLRNLVLCLLAVAAGDMVRSRREMSERAADLREQQTLRRVADERLAIAHEIHDVVAHGMTAINVQAGVAAHLLDRDPEQARGALRDIKRVSGEALTELRTTLAVLRDPDGAAPLAPAGGIGNLAALVDAARAAGVEVALTVAPDLDPRPPAVDHAAYRIVQEALTNVARHSGATAARVSVGRCDGGLAVEVVDDGCGGHAAIPAAGTAADAPGSGHGLLGMRERVRALGGRLTVGPEPDGGWIVRASLPVAEVREHV